MKQKSITGKKVNIGEYKDGKIYKEIVFDKHFFFKGQSFGVDKALIDKHKFDFLEIVLRDKVSRHTYVANRSVFWKNAYLYEQPKFQPQYMLKRKFWAEYDENGKLL